MFGWLDKLRRRRAPTKLHIEGVVRAKRRATPRTRLGPTPAPEEASFDIEVERAWLSDGTELVAHDLFPTEFAGPLDLLDRFDAGTRVRIVCTTSTGRLIESMVSSPDADAAEPT